MTTPEIATLKQLCTDPKLDPRETIRDPKTGAKLTNTHKSRGPWQWGKNAPTEKVARTLVARETENPQVTPTPQKKAELYVITMEKWQKEKVLQPPTRGLRSDPELHAGQLRPHHATTSVAWTT